MNLFIGPFSQQGVDKIHHFFRRGHIPPAFAKPFDRLFPLYGAFDIFNHLPHTHLYAGNDAAVRHIRRLTDPSSGNGKSVWGRTMPTSIPWSFKVSMAVRQTRLMVP